MNKRIEQIIDYLSISKAEFAKEIEVQRSSISHLTSGRNNPSLDIVVKILTRYPILSTDWLLFGTGSMLKDNNHIDDNGSIESNNTNSANIVNGNKNQQLTNLNSTKEQISQVTNVTTEENATNVNNNHSNQQLNANTNKSQNVDNTPEQVLVLFNDNTFKTYQKRD